MTIRPTVGTVVHHIPRQAGRAPACVDAVVTEVRAGMWVYLDGDCLGVDLDTGTPDAASSSCDGLRHAPGTWHWPTA